MAEFISSGHVRTRNYCVPILFLLAATAAALTVMRVYDELHGASFWGAIWSAHSGDFHQLIVRDSILPRVAVTLLCGAALALAGTLAQQVLRNPLAEPMTLGVMPGAYLAVTVAAIWAPGWLDGRKELVALGGGGTAILLVFLLAWSQRMSTLAVILAGMVVNLLCGAVSMAIAWTHYELLQGVMIWGGGALDQSGWGVSEWLAVRVGLAVLPVWALSRPLAVFEAGDSTVRSLGISVQRMRLIALLVTVALAAFVVASVGVIGFVGLAAPIIARLAGARRVAQRLVLAPLLGALLLWATDEVVQTISAGGFFPGHLIPTGTVTSLLGVPFLIAMLPRLRAAPDVESADAARAPTRMPGWCLPLWIVLALATLSTSLLLTRSFHGWRLLARFDLLLLWGLPHTLGAIAAGALLALSGTLLQRMTGNPMASPDLLGVSSGGALGIVFVMFVANPITPAVLLGGCLSGAMVTLGMLVWLGGRTGFAPERMILIGVALTAFFQSVVGAVMASGDSRAALLLNLMLGNTYFVQPATAYTAVGVAFLALVLVPLLARWLQALALGAQFADGIGVPVIPARFAVLLFASILTAVSTLVVGPSTFVGLIAPHLARFSGARRPATQAWVAALIGGVLLGLSEWLSRQVAFPEAMPTGLVATLVGSGYFVAMLLRRRS
ncbi:Fe(3+)-hydroxamate ABC transporter permease FhuB [Paraburkholderia sp. BCC1885]|uniref:Fe(3+)-hydroxamate ABC transporter permease FhuB n=1 Tax=Paraburkholderia sp. BCC1885 TaxID=2562669 RepID=UPI0021B2A58C|nr:Fe(3+)-hydroxamate ABC transporter permease FhuB [Paraburkholderia sp. BCC1885]